MHLSDKWKRSLHLLVRHHQLLHGTQQTLEIASKEANTDRHHQLLHGTQQTLEIASKEANTDSRQQLKTNLTVELFLVKDVDYVVTDRDDYSKQSRQLSLATPSPFCSVSPSLLDSPTDAVISKRTRSRGEAMLEKVRRQPQKNTADVLDNALIWRIPIYPLSKFLLWLEKLVEKRRSEASGRELRGHYIKLEAGSGRPDFRQFREWPRILYTTREPGAFPPPKPLSRHDPQRMTRKVGKTGKEFSSAPGGGNGYCEICRAHYDQLDTHISSSQHLKLVSDPSQYSQLDSLITHHDLGNVSSLRKSLRIAKSPFVDMGVKVSVEPPPAPPLSPLLNGHVTRSRTDKVLCNGLSPVEKKKKEIKTGINCGSDKEWSEKERDEPKLGRRHSSKQPEAASSQPQPKRSKLARKRLSVEEKLIEDNKSYYKVEVLNSKLRSTEYFISQKQVEARVNGALSEKGEGNTKEPVVVRFKKVRKTQLAVLSDEAENFMFGELSRKEESSDDSHADSDSSSRDDDDPPTKKRKRKCFTASRKSPSPKYRFEQSMVLPLSQADEKSDDEEINLELSDITFTFEKPPRMKSWMDSYEAEKDGSSFYFPFYHEYPQTVLPSEYSVSERLKLLSGKMSGYRRRRDRLSRIADEGRPRKSPRCHASTLAIMSSLMRRRPLRECSSNPDFTYEEESRSSLPETVESSSSASDGRLAVCESSLLPVEPTGDAYAIALARLACGETSTFQLAPGPCLPVDPTIFYDPPPTIELSPHAGLDIPLCHLMEQHPLSHLQHRLLDFDLRFPLDGDSGSDCSDLIGFADDGRGVSGRRRKRKRNLTGWPVGKPRKKLVKVKEELSAPVIKCEPCEIKVEPLCQEMLDRFPFKVEPAFDDDGVSLPVIPIKRGRGRPRKYPLLIPPTFSSPLTSPATSPKKKCVTRFTFGGRRSCVK